MDNAREPMIQLSINRFASSAFIRVHRRLNFFDGGSKNFGSPCAVRFG
jgi:hypothetical protein